MPRQYTPQVALVCPVCGETFHRPPNIAKLRKFCSSACANQQRPLRKPRITKSCAACGKPFDVPLRMQHHRFCSLECGRTSRSVDQGFMKSCPTCGTEFYTTTKSKRIYCSRACANDRQRENNRKICVSCGATFQARAESAGKYCSHQCRNDHTRRKPHVCPQCGKMYQPNSPNQKYCTPACQQLGHRKRVTLTCSTCGKVFETMQSLVGRRRYCSRRCHLTDQFHSHEEDEAVAIVAGLLNSIPIRQHTFPWLLSERGRAMYVDAYFPDHRVVVEYDGRQHREFNTFYHRTLEYFQEMQRRDRLKDELIRSHGMSCLRIPDNEPRTLEHIRQRLAEL